MHLARQYFRGAASRHSMAAMNQSQSPRWFPLFLNLAGQRVLVIGDGEVAARKTRRLLQFDADIEWVGRPEARKNWPDWLQSGRIVQRGNRFLSEMVDGQVLIVVADCDQATIDAVKQTGRTLGVPVNVVDQLEDCSAIFPAVVDRDPVTIAIGTGGQAPELARIIRSHLETLLPASIGPLAKLAGSLQHRLRKRLPEPARRRRFLDWLFNDAPARAIDQGKPDAARRLALAELNHMNHDRPGHVALVGAGPGDPELLTIKAMRLIQSADVIVHDGLVDDRVLGYTRRDVELIDVAKRRGFRRASQDEINRLLIEHALQGKRTVRLKGGDPLVFGRGGEEMQALRQAGVDYSVVPGITAAVACGAYAGIPLTHRDHAQSVRLVTAHCRASIDRLDWADLAADRQTLAFYMAVAQLERIQDQLLAHGRKPATPIALVENGTRPDQRVVTGTLAALAETGRAHAIASPAMLYVGAVADLANTLCWYGGPELSSRPVAQRAAC